MSGGVRRRVTFTYIARRGEVAVPVILSWEPVDPLAFQIRFPRQKVWTFSRELLMDALVCADPAGVGDGDYHWCPDERRSCLLLELAPPWGYAEFRVRRATLTSFLAATVAQESVDPFTELEKWLLAEVLRGVQSS